MLLLESECSESECSESEGDEVDDAMAFSDFRIVGGTPHTIRRIGVSWDTYVPENYWADLYKSATAGQDVFEQYMVTESWLTDAAKLAFRGLTDSQRQRVRESVLLLAPP